MSVAQLINQSPTVMKNGYLDDGVVRGRDRDGNPTHDHWETPSWLYWQLNKEFKFTLDPCPLNSTFDGLSIEWGRSNFINPPYNRFDKPKFIQKAFDEFNSGKSSVLLIPSVTGTIQFHEIIKPFAQVRFIKGRVAFKGFNSKGEYATTGKGKHDSMIVIFNENYEPNLK